MLAEAGDSLTFDFTSFQRGFGQAWDLIVPNVILILLCIGTAKFVGNLKLKWLSTPAGQVKAFLQQFSTFLEETKLFGSKLIPILACVVLGVTALDVFDYVKVWFAKACPPQVGIDRNALYARVALKEDLLHIALKRQSITETDQLYQYLVEWEDQIREDKTLPGASDVNYWIRNGVQWYGYSGMVKILFVVALSSSIVGVHPKKVKWPDFSRLLPVPVFLFSGFDRSLKLGGQLRF
jgi:hypothetical protein